ncbi:glycosyltransferase family 4 protein [Aquimarina sp. M1]
MNHQSPGLNIIGYTEGLFGLGEAVRLNIHAARKTNIPLNIINFEKVKQDIDYEYSFKYSVNLVQISSNDLDDFFRVINPEFFRDKYTILFLMWESEYLPEKLKKNVTLFNEIWTASSYCQKLFKKIFNGDIIVVPHPIEVNLKSIQNQNPTIFFNENKFSYLFIFSYHSSIERKNPFFLIEAFIKAFGNNQDVELVIKTNGAKHFKNAERKLYQARANQKNITIIDFDLDRNEINHLINNCDCYVSMHHSEGFGLTLAEAMCLSKATIATNYSGNTQFMNENNSFLVDYELGLIENPDANFGPKTLWGNPMMEDTIKKLKEVYENADLRKEKAKNAQHYVQEKLSFYAIGSIIKNRLNHLYINFESLAINENQNTYLLNELQLTKIEISKLQKEVKRMKKNLIIRFIMILKNQIRKMKGKK